MTDSRLRSSQSLKPTLVCVLVVVMAVLANSCSLDDADPSVTFDGSGCSYEGSSEFDLGSTVTFTFLSTADHREVGFAIWRVPEGTTTARAAKGFFALGADVDFLANKFPPTVPGFDYDSTVVFDAPGLYAFSCLDASVEAEYAHVFNVSNK